ncbi:MAG TPA: hypothetical protein VGF46_05625, partial [Gaiellales bacterium]
MRARAGSSAGTETSSAWPSCPPVVETTRRPTNDGSTHGGRAAIQPLARHEHLGRADPSIATAS